MKNWQADVQNKDSINGSSASLMDQISLHHHNLRQYCHALTGSPWEGDDLVQDTWLKVWSALHRGLKEEQVTLTYLYRVARNAWIDQHRKKSLAMSQQPLEDMQQPDADPMEVWVAMETLVQQLAPGQRTAFLLVEVLKYTPAEAAAMMKSSEGAIKAALHRARVKLRSTGRGNAQQDKKLQLTVGSKGRFSEALQKNLQDIEGNSRDSSFSSTTDEEHLRTYAYVEAFRQQNTAALVMLMNDGTRAADAVSLLYAKTRENNAVRQATRISDQKTVHGMYLLARAA